ncbi:MAG: hypothetical protein KKD44_04715 [Proteobacteria bacterium]|nr:hypothetical protein [Pseudomonadota bacterium]
MTPQTRKQLNELHIGLIKISQAWAMKKPYDKDRATELRHEAALINHAHYVENIPAYRRLSEEADLLHVADVDLIKKELMSTDDIFKSYDQTWLDDHDYEKMNAWIGSIFHDRININTAGVRTIDQWVDRLTESGITPVYSSGTTGRFSFIPRCEMSWKLFTTAPVSYSAPVWADLGVIPLYQKVLMGPLLKLLHPDTFSMLLKKRGLPGFAGVFMNFRKGNMGIQLVGQELSHLFRKTCFLYDTDLSASAIRIISRGIKNDADLKILESFQKETIEKKDENYMKLIDFMKRATLAGEKVFLFGAPYQLKELSQVMIRENVQIPLKKKSCVFFGGGWKSFEGEKIERHELVEMVSDRLNVPDELIVEGYSMTEVNGLMVRCHHGRFHIPPVIEPVILDEALEPQEGCDLKGPFGFIDPFAVSYPGFIISGDNVRMRDEICPCGMHGPALTEVGRAQGREIKGCGGIMASVQA